MTSLEPKEEKSILYFYICQTKECLFKRGSLVVSYWIELVYFHFWLQYDNEIKGPLVAADTWMRRKQGS